MEKEFKKIKSTYENMYTELSKMKNEIVRFEYSKGGNVFFRGIYTPYLSLKYGMYANSPGKKIKTEKNFTFKYGFNKNNELIYVLRNLDGIMMEEFIMYHQDYEIGVYFDQRIQQLTDITICKYSNGLLSSVHYAHIMYLMRDFSFSLTEEIYGYDKGELINIEIVSCNTRYPKRYCSLYDINKNEFKLAKQWIV